MQRQESTSGEFESTLKKHAHELVESLERGHFGDAVQLIHELNQTRDRGLYQEVGKLTRELHNAIVDFHIDPTMPRAEEVSQNTDAAERLAYVVKLTEAAANRTMDLVEHCTPLVNGLGQEAKALSADWGRFMRREIGAEEFRDLARRVDSFLTRSETEQQVVSSHLTDILLAQDYQDLTGQVIKKVTVIAQDLEKQLVQMLVDYAPAQVKRELDNSLLNGPQINPSGNSDVVSNQGQVDDLLDSLGF